jgi:hypothetical protein
VGELTGWSKDLRVTADGEGVVGMVGVAALRMLADRIGLTQILSAILARPGFRPVHDLLVSRRLRHQGRSCAEFAMALGAVLDSWTWPRRSAPAKAV